MSLPAIHRVVTGHDRDGKAIVASDGPLPTVVELQAIPGMIFHEVWETQGMPAPVDNAADPTNCPTMHGPPRLGTRIRFVDFPPEPVDFEVQEQVVKSLFDELNNAEGSTATANSPHPLMHRTEAVDYGIVIEGELTLVLDDSEVALKTGSVVIQRGTNHAWANRSGRQCRMLFIQIDGQYEPAIAEALMHR